ncbi:tyrosine-type recombinase/integrase [Myxococcota bacterium]
MASVFKRADRWYLHYKDASGRWRRRVSTARTKTEARRMVEDLQRRADRQRMGLEPMETGCENQTIDELMDWWLTTYSKGTPSHEVNQYAVRKHLIGTSLSKISLAALTSGEIERFIQAKSKKLAPGTLNHLRKYLVTAINRAREAGLFNGPNPAARVKRRRVPRALPNYLKVHEVLRVLAALEPRWRPLFATAIYTGLRKGELFALRKIDVDFESRLLAVHRSHDRDGTKGGHADVIPIPAELVPFLARAIDDSPSELVFPDENGERLSRNTKLSKILRRAMGRAKVVTGYKHVCRRHGCGHKETAPDSEQRRCPNDGRKLWPKPLVRAIRFHDLRHTTASLLMMAGANPAAVQRIMRHSDPRLTTEVYGHLEPNYLQAEADRLSFGVRAELAARPESKKLGINMGQKICKRASLVEKSGRQVPGRNRENQKKTADCERLPISGKQRIRLWELGAPSSNPGAPTNKSTT